MTTQLQVVAREHPWLALHGLSFCLKWQADNDMGTEPNTIRVTRTHMLSRRIGKDASAVSNAFADVPFEKLSTNV